jgi:hypothetical protein
MLQKLPDSFGIILRQQMTQTAVLFGKKTKIQLAKAGHPEPVTVGAKVFAVRHDKANAALMLWMEKFLCWPGMGVFDTQ